VNPNVRVKQGSDGERMEYVDPLEDWAEMLFSKQGALAILGVDLLVNGGELLGGGLELIGEAAAGLGEVI